MATVAGVEATAVATELAPVATEPAAETTVAAATGLVLAMAKASVIPGMAVCARVRPLVSLPPSLRACFSCGELGHRRRDCQRGGAAGGRGGGDSSKKN